MIIKPAKSALILAVMLCFILTPHNHAASAATDTIFEKTIPSTSDSINCVGETNNRVMDNVALKNATDSYNTGTGSTEQPDKVVYKNGRLAVLVYNYPDTGKPRKVINYSAKTGETTAAEEIMFNRNGTCIQKKSYGKDLTTVERFSPDYGTKIEEQICRSGSNTLINAWRRSESTGKLIMLFSTEIMKSIGLIKSLGGPVTAIIKDMTGQEAIDSTGLTASFSESSGNPERIFIFNLGDNSPLKEMSFDPETGNLLSLTMWSKDDKKSHVITEFFPRTGDTRRIMKYDQYGLISKEEFFPAINVKKHTDFTWETLPKLGTVRAPKVRFSMIDRSDAQ